MYVLLLRSGNKAVLVKSKEESEQEWESHRRAHMRDQQRMAMDQGREGEGKAADIHKEQQPGRLVLAVSRKGGVSRTARAFSRTNFHLDFPPIQRRPQLS